MDEEHPDDMQIDERIMNAYAKLTPREKQLAEVVLRAQSSLSSYTAAELADTAGVSAATAARFFRRLGYSTYNEARLHSRRNAGWGSPFEHLQDTLSQAGDFHLHVAQDSENLSRTLETMDISRLEEAVGYLAQARRIWIVGYRNSRALAQYAHMLLLNFSSDVHLLPRDAGASLGEDLASIRPDDTVLVIAMRRRPRVLGEVVTIAREAGASVIMISDPTLGETGANASVSLRCQNKGAGIFDSMVVPISLINHLCARLVATKGAALKERLAEIERLHERVDDLSSAISVQDLPNFPSESGD
ncbi:MurR/RpiR family transcriptional regulator [Celeribacter naphthalenivorans]|uniref:MurR/RpiR family transcriptional regulator n=1 Tax=Celeribacter naphthalenivorans TaxID=1614694 RepID=UPI001CFB52D8|nr:MurR/RpiR family transcriptional regulator [Celeribacter naphthalenivorans]